jgi:hydrogenase maturation factor
MRWCRREMKVKADREDIKKRVIEILRSSKKLRKNGKIVLVHNGVKVGFIKREVPPESIEIQSYWKSRIGVKVEISYNGEFIGIVFIREWI